MCRRSCRVLRAKRNAQSEREAGERQSAGLTELLPRRFPGLPPLVPELYVEEVEIDSRRTGVSEDEPDRRLAGVGESVPTWEKGERPGKLRVPRRAGKGSAGSSSGLRSTSRVTLGDRELDRETVAPSNEPAVVGRLGGDWSRRGGWTLVARLTGRLSPSDSRRVRCRSLSARVIAIRSSERFRTWSSLERRRAWTLFSN